MERRIGSLFIISGLLLLMLGAFVGVLISINYVLPDFLQEYIPFNQLRPFHTTSVTSWIILTVTGGVYYYISREVKLHSSRVAMMHYLVFAFTFLCIVISYFVGNMGGREYLEFPPILILPILVGWGLFGYNYFKSIVGKIRHWPVYYWMWGTGIVFMIFHLSESNFWWFSHFRSDFIRDMTVQWKSYGSFVGSWNMLVYGTAIFVMAKIKKDKNPGRGKLPFFFYFLGLTNLMFGWAHHTYALPTMPWVRYVAYGISMTEWVIFIRMIYIWSRSIGKRSKVQYRVAYLFLLASDVWVFMNLLMALLISIPYLNNFSHGTHITVAHSMGTTIGINTMILFASISYIIENRKLNFSFTRIRNLFYLVNIALLGFLGILISLGIKKAIWMERTGGRSISELHYESRYLYAVFVAFGVILGISLILLSIRYLRVLWKDLIYLIFPRSIQEEWDRIYKEN